MRFATMADMFRAARYPVRKLEQGRRRHRGRRQDRPEGLAHRRQQGVRARRRAPRRPSMVADRQRDSRATWRSTLLQKLFTKHPGARSRAAGQDAACSERDRHGEPTMSEPEAPNKPAGRAGRNLELPEHLKSYKGVWVFIEHDRGAVHPVSWELLGEGRKLADKLGVRTVRRAAGRPGRARSTRFAKEAFHYGADRCYVMRDPVLKGYRNEPFTKGLTDLVNTLPAGDRAAGRDHHGPRPGGHRWPPRCGTGLTADCTELNIDPATAALAATRPTFGGSPAVHHHDARLPAADGDGAAARDADAARATQRAPATSSRHRSAWSRPTSSPRCSTSSPTPAATSRQPRLRRHHRLRRQGPEERRRTSS